jgi:hypothetical protein
VPARLRNVNIVRTASVSDGRLEGQTMLDIILIAVGVVSFALFFAYTSACDHL